jgi:PBP superfamily domain
MYATATRTPRPSRHSTWTPFALLILAACAEPPGDPMVFVHELRKAHASPEADHPRLIRAEPGEAPPAPLVETSRGEDPRRHRLGLAMSRGLLEITGPDFADRVRAAVPDLELLLTATGDRDAIDLVRVGRQDAALVLGDLSPRDVQSGLQQVWLGSEVFAVAAAAGNQVTNLSPGQLRGMLTGHLNTWAKLGGSAGAVQLVLPEAPERLQRAAHVLLPGDSLAMRCVRTETDQAVFEQIRRRPGAAGLITLTAAPRDNDIRLLTVDKVPPMAETFAVGTYPYGLKLLLVTSGSPGDLAEMLLGYLRTPEGKEPFAQRLVVF